MDIGGWLRSLGLEEYEAAFHKNHIDETVLPNLTAEDLKDLGVGSIGHRRKLLDAIALLRGDAEAKAKAPPLEAPSVPKPSHDTAERRQVTVMFCDLVGSTALSARMDPEDLREVISAYQKRVAETVQRFGGFVAKYMGDGVLVYFGYPQAHEDDAERAVRAGLELIQAVGGLKSSVPMQTRVGVATGLVVVGDLIGSGEAQERGIIGETPNLAARLQGIAEPDTVVIAVSTRRLLGNLFELRDLGRRDVKGISEPVQAWAAVRPSSVESRFEALRTATTPLVGRDEELDLLLRRWEQAKRGDGCVVLISGEPGIGKSRIAEAIQERLGAEPHTRLRFFCSPYHQDSALYPSITHLERAARLHREDTADQRLDKLDNLLAQATNNVREVAPLFADLLSIPTGERYPALTVSPQKRKEKMLAALIAQVEGLSVREPVLIIYEDVHWSDPTTRELLDLLIDCIPKLRVLLIITFRPEFSPPWVGRPEVTLVTLNRLLPRQRMEMIALVTAGKRLPKEVADQIVERTDGVPLFIEELTKSVVESGLVTEAGDHYVVVGPATALAIPTSLHASLLARLDRLAPTREVAQIGAALGRSFSHELIRAVAQMPQQKIDEALDQLVRAELVFRRGTPPYADYTFKHALVQDAAYSTLLRSRRQQIHQLIVSTLEAQFPDIVASQPQLLAHHCAEAGLNERAVGYRLKAGQQSVARSEMPEAVAQLGKGLDVLLSLPDGAWRQQQELDLRVALGPALIATKGYAAADVAETVRRARELAAQLNRPDYLVGLLYGQWGVHVVGSELLAALACGEEMEQIGHQQQNTVVVLMARLYQAIVRFSLGELTVAFNLLKECLQLKDPAYRAASAALTPEDPYLMTLSWIAVTSAALGYIEQARAHISEALSVVAQLEKAQRQAYSHCFVLMFASGTEWTAGSADGVKQHSDRLVSLADEHGFPYLWASGLLYGGWAAIALGDPNEGLSLIEKGLATNRAIGAAWGIAWYLIWQADARGKLGQHDLALELLAEAEALMVKTGERFMEPELFLLQGVLATSMGDGIIAERNYQQALDVSKRRSARVYQLRAATSMARLWRDQGKRDEARELLAPVYGWFTEGFDTRDLKDAKALLNELAA